MKMHFEFSTNLKAIRTMALLKDLTLPLDWETEAVFEMAYLLTALYTVHTAYYFLKNSVWNSIQYTTNVSE